ncbi:Titin [Cyphomyrmex costatus]|uniref:Titin n=1 Tax=Cyphomyrmex costatus TaxID=456900 RepID=A0A151IE47_9HYME|nr:Titin [Cyphomyrmex costatus]
MMIDGPDLMAHVHPERSVEMNSEIVMQRNEDTSQQIISPTTTISTIAVQSGEMRVVIALLQEFQDKAIKITKSTERLVSSGHFAGEQATKQAFAILSTATDYINNLDQYNMLLNKTMAFFDLAQSAIIKLDQFEIQLITTEHPYSTRLARLHAQILAMIENVISKPLSEGYALLDITGREAPDKHNILQAWLTNIAKIFLQKHQNMGSDLAMAYDFRQIHCQFLVELENKSEEVDHLEILPITEHPDEIQKYELQLKIKNLEDELTKIKIAIVKRIELSTIYIQFYEIVEELTYEIDFIDNKLKNENVIDEATFNELKERWKSFEFLYNKLDNHAKTLLNETNNIDDFYLDVSQTCLCVQTLLEKFANRQLIITEWWKKWQITVEVIRQRRMEYEQKVEESKETLAWITKFEMTLYPVITTPSSRITDILDNLQDARIRISSKLNNALHELDTKIESIQVFVEREDLLGSPPSLPVSPLKKGKIDFKYDIIQHLLIYMYVLEYINYSPFVIFKIERKIEEAKQESECASNSTKLIDVDDSLNKFNILKSFITESLLQIRTKSEKIIGNIRLQEPLELAIQDIEKLNRMIDSVHIKFELFQTETSNRLEEHLHLCIFRKDIEKINSDLRELNEQLKEMDGRIGDNLSVLKTTLTTFEQFEQTITILDRQIETFVKKTEETIVPLTSQVTDEILSLHNRWDHLKKHVRDTKKRMHLSTDYFVLLEEAKQWIREGNKLLVITARKATTVRVPEEAIDLLREIDVYIKPGEDQQEKRIEKLRQLSTIIFGTDRLPQFNEIIVENRQMLDSFAVSSSELRTLSQNLQNAEDLREKLQIETLKADKKLQAVKIEMVAVEAAKIEAEDSKKLPEQFAAETLDKTEIEAKKLKEEQTQKIVPSISHSISAQTDETIVEKTIHKASTVTTKEIHILQKMEIEKDIPVIQTEISPSGKLVSKEICHELLEHAKKTQINEVVSVAPEFTVPLNNATVQEGKEFSFECHLIGQPIPKIVWYKDGISILNNSDYLATYANGVCILKIEETFAEDSAKYTCRAFNIHGSVETSATLTVKGNLIYELDMQIFY